MIQDLSKIEEQITGSSTWVSIKEFLGLHMNIGKDISVSILDILIIISAIFLTSVVLRIALRIITRNLPNDDKGKFNVIYGYFRWLVYLIIFLITLHSVGVNVTAVF